MSKPPAKSSQVMPDNPVQAPPPDHVGQVEAELLNRPEVYAGFLWRMAQVVEWCFIHPDGGSEVPTPGMLSAVAPDATFVHQLADHLAGPQGGGDDAEGQVDAQVVGPAAWRRVADELLALMPPPG